VDFTYPAENSYLPKTLDIVGSSHEKPELITRDGQKELWIQTHHKFKKPKANVQFRIDTIKTRSPKEHATELLYVAALTKYLSRSLADALDAGYIYSFSNHEIQFSGYTDNLVPFATKALSLTRKMDLSSTEFKSTKDQLIQNKENQRFLPAYLLAAGIELHRVLTPDTFSPEEILPFLRELTLEDIQAYGKNFLQRGFVRGLGFGNITPNQLLEVYTALKTNFPMMPLAPELRERDVEVRLLDGNGNSNAYEFWSAASGENNAYLLTYNLGPTTPKLHAIAQIGNSVLETPFFKEMRTEKGLGYIVKAGIDAELLSTKVSFLIQTEYPLEQIRSHVTEWIPQSVELFRDLTPEKFEQLREAALERLSKEPTSFDQQFSHTSETIFDYDRDTLWKQKQIEALKMITQEEILETFEKAFSYKGGAPTLTIYIVGQDREKGQCVRPKSKNFFERPELITDVEEFRRKMPRYRKY